MNNALIEKSSLCVDNNVTAISDNISIPREHRYRTREDMKNIFSIRFLKSLNNRKIKQAPLTVLTFLLT